jgi:hypothetical protein
MHAPAIRWVGGRGRPPKTCWQIADGEGSSCELRSLSHLANILAAQADLATAHRLQERALAIYEAHLGVDHPDTTESRRQLEALTASESPER